MLSVITALEFFQHYFSEMGHRDLLVTQNLSQAIKQPTLSYLTRSVRRRAATSKRFWVPQPCVFSRAFCVFFFCIPVVSIGALRMVLRRCGFCPAPKRPPRINRHHGNSFGLATFSSALALLAEISENPCCSGNRESLDVFAPIRMTVGIRKNQRNPHE